MDELSAAAICKALHSGFFGRQVVYCPTIDSTNSVAKTLAQQGAPEGTLVIADEQTAGRGRLGRRWLAPRGTCLLFSLVFRPGLKVDRAQSLNMICGLGIRQAIHELTALPAQLKWPNDIMLHGRKTGGILTEMSSSGERLDYVVVGIGLNVNVDISALPAEFRATSIAHELGRTIPRLPLLNEALRFIEQRYSALRAGESPLADWAAA
ncbi:MAG: biotin--[acetyl-CoA-carboxylase] ligase, partial [Anaerolineales bacterium]